VQATEADAIRLHDDISSYTGGRSAGVSSFPYWLINRGDHP
jgi:hypothetical protein